MIHEATQRCTNVDDVAEVLAEKEDTMKIKSIIPPTLFISAVLALNGIATAIDTPQVYQKTEYKVVSNIQIDVKESQTK